MGKIARTEFLEYLEGEWQSYTNLFRMLSEEDKEVFLKKQGYSRLGDLLGHIIAWWQDAVQFIDKAVHEPQLPLPEIEVDAFNAQAVAQVAQLSDPDIVRAYETQRQTMVKLVKSLSDAEIDRSTINTRLYYEVIGHWEEHEIEG